MLGFFGKGYPDPDSNRAAVKAQQARTARNVADTKNMFAEAAMALPADVLAGLVAEAIRLRHEDMGDGAFGSMMGVLKDIEWERGR